MGFFLLVSNCCLIQAYIDYKNDSAKFWPIMAVLYFPLCSVIWKLQGVQRLNVRKKAIYITGLVIGESRSKYSLVENDSNTYIYESVSRL